MTRNSREGTEDVSILSKNSEGEALRNMINKLSDERNLKDLHLKHYHMSTEQFEKRTTLGRSCKKLSRERTSGRRELGDLIFLHHGSAKIGDKTFGFLIVLDGATSHLTAYPCKSTSPSEVISKLHEWIDTFQMNPKAICADMAYHQPHDIQAFYRMHNVKRLPTGPHTPWPNRAEMGVRLFKKFLSALVDTASKNLDQTTLSQITPAQLMRKAATVRNTQVTQSGETPMELAMGRRLRDLLDPASMNPEQLTSTPTKQNLLIEEIQKLAIITHLKIQQREDILQGLVERMKFVPPDLRAGENVFYWQEDPSKIQQGRKSGKWLKVEIITVKGPMAVVSSGATIFRQV